MASYFLPSFLSGWDIPSISAFSLSANLQRRLLSYILKRSLGHLVQGGQLDLDQIDAGIGSGKVEIRNVQLDAQAINAQLPSLPVSFHSGEIGRISVQLPLPNIWSGELTVAISDIKVQLQPSTVDWSELSQHNLQETLSASFASAASELLERDEEGRELEQSIHESMAGDDFNASSGSQDVEVGSVIGSYVEALLARLKLSVQNVRIELLTKHLDLCLVLNNASLHSTTSRSDADSAAAGSSPADKLKKTVSETIRTAELDSIEIWILDKSDKTAVSPKVANDSDEEESDSSSVADSFSSIYESAIQERTSASTTSATDHPQPSYCKLFSTGTDPVRITVTTRKEREAILPPSSRTTTTYRLTRVDSQVQIAIGHLAAIVSVDQLVPLLILSDQLNQKTAQDPSVSPKNKAKARSSIPTRIEVACSVKTATMILGYDDPLIQPAQKTPDDFWARPTRLQLDSGHLRLSCETILAQYVISPSGPGSASSPVDLTLSVLDLRIFEHLSQSLSNTLPPEAQKLFPVLVFDPNLVRQSEHSASARTRSQTSQSRSPPSLDTLDWRFDPSINTASRTNTASTSPRTARFSTDGKQSAPHSNSSPYFRTTYGDRGWKLRPRDRMQVSHQPDDDASTPACIIVSCTQPAGIDQGRISVSLAPLHLFLDISLITRVLPSLKRAASQLASARNTSFRRDTSASLASLSASIATVHASPRTFMSDLRPPAQSQPSYAFELRSETIRVEIRTPQVSYSETELANQDLRVVRSLGLSRRCGLFLLEVQGLDLTFGLTERANKSRGVHFSGAASYHEQLDESGLVSGRITVKKVATYMTLPEADTKAVQIATVEAIADDASPGEVFPRLATRLLPRMIISRGGEPRDQDEHKQQLSCLIPAVNIELAKQPIDSLQYMIDDLTQWSSLWSFEHLDDSEDSVNESLRVLGSRFFGGQSTQSIMSASTESTSTARNLTKRSAFAAGVTEISVRLHLPQLQPHSVPMDLVLSISDVEVLFESDQTHNTSLIDARVSTFTLEVEVEGVPEPTVLLQRTLDASLDAPSSSVLSIAAEAYSEPGTSYRKQGLNIVVSGLTFSPLFDDSLLQQIRLLLKSPAGVFENVEPNEVTRISVKIRNCTLHIAPHDCEPRAALVLGEASIKTKLTSHAPKTTVKLALANTNLFVIDRELGPSQARRSRAASVSAHWLGFGFARVINISECKAAMHLNSLTRPETDVKITKLRVKVQVCADTLEVIGTIVSAFTRAAEARSESPNKVAKVDIHETEARARSDSEGSYASYGTQTTTNLMSDIDDQAFKLSAPAASQADLMEDDVPSDPTFLGARGRYHPDLIETSLDDDEFFGGESVASLSIAAPISNRVVHADEDVTIRILDPNGISPVPEYFTDPKLRPHTDSLPGSSAISVRVRVTNFDLSVRLHSGYDWVSTQKAVEEEAKKVRRRLQKIKQLLAEGQVPDDSVEAATSNLLDSVYISLPHNRADMDPSELMQAMDEELGDFSETSSAVSTTNTWQSMPAPVMDRGSGLDAAPSRRKKLQRSTRSVIEFNFGGLEVEVDQIDASELSNIAARIAVAAKRFEIIDNVKTSTWHTFLTEIKDSDHAFSRGDENRMIKIEVLTVRSEAASQGDAMEYRLRARIAPLRLHVDQDALDFLKKFFAFKAPGHNAAEKGPSAAAPSSFIQFAEILPIKIKLDYKPKRVDYNLLRQGRTIELMNFFHFEGAEMVLRHITLRGITGWGRLFDTLNDIWTPDVKANQLADVLSGVAPIRSLVNVGAGLADLVLLPIEQYHKDGRLLRGVQKGATSFAKSTALEAVKLGARLATGTQVILEHAEHILGGRMPEAVTARAVGPEGRTDSYASLSESMMLPPARLDEHAPGEGERRLSEESVAQFSRYASQPEDMQEALSQAYSGLSRGLTSAAQTILAIPMEVYEPSSSSSGGSARPVVRAVPVAILRGARGATEAIAKTMQGVQASLGDKQAAQEGKYKQDPRGGHSRHS